MRYAIISDIHGNLEALQAVIKECKDQGARAYFCIGDIVGYGANPIECIDIVRDLKALCVAGNHDWGVSGKLDIKYFNPFAKEAIFWTQKILSKGYINYLNNLKTIIKQEEFILVHGTLNKPKKFGYLNDINKAFDTFYLMDRNICFIGHTHIPQIMIKKGNNIFYSEEQSIKINPEYKYIINIGSVGQPRDGNPQASYCIYDPDLERVEIKRIDYDIKSVQNKIILAGLPSVLARRLTIGQ